MKITNWILICLLAVALAPVGCGKKEDKMSIKPPQVTLDAPKMRSAFASATPELKAMADEALKYVEFGRSYPTGLTILEKLANAPGLTDEQKKVVTDVIGQVKQLMAQSGTAPAQ
jgi:hypothetical protein